NTEINEIKVSPNEIITSGEDIANHLNQHFSEIGVKLSSVGTQNYNVRPEMFLKQSEETFRIHDVDSDKVLKLLKNLKTTKACGLDNIPNRLDTLELLCIEVRKPKDTLELLCIE
ncbi:Hypothetical predicted protein, partial [Paramuricea clavata]